MVTVIGRDLNICGVNVVNNCKIVNGHGTKQFIDFVDVIFVRRWVINLQILGYIFNCRQSWEFMKNIRSQPTSYKDFINKISQVEKAKGAKTPRHQDPVLKQVKGLDNLLQKSNSKNYVRPVSPHTQSTSLWDKQSSCRKKVATQASAEKQSRSHNQSLIQNEIKHQTITQKDRQMCYHKFISESMLIMSKIFKNSSAQMLNHRISYIQYLEAMKGMKLIHENYQPYPNDMITELWSEFVSGENAGNFLIAISSILGHYTGKQTQTDIYLRKKYESLKFTRLQRQGNQLDEQERLTPNQCTFMPQISDRSRKLATSRSREHENSGRKHIQCLKTDRSNMSNPKRMERKNHSIEEQFQDENSNIEQYTNLNIRSKDPTGNKRSNLLYKLAKQKSAQKLPNKTKNDMDYEKNAQQLTFKPKILKSKASSKEKLNNKCVVKGQNNSISRMIRGRVQKQVRRIINDKGVPYNEKLVDKMRRTKYEEIVASVNLDLKPFESSQDQQMLLQDEKKNSSSFNTAVEERQSRNSFGQAESMNLPLSQIQPKRPSAGPDLDLVIDVYISEDHKEKLIIHRGQALFDVATRFISQHGLPESKRDQLIQLLEISLTQALTPIDELVEEQELTSARTDYGRKQQCR